MPAYSLSRHYKKIIMRYTIFVMLSVFISFSTKGQVTLEGKISGIIIQSFNVYTPILSYYNLNNSERAIPISVDSLGRFKTKLNLNEDYGYLTISINERNIYLIFQRFDSIVLNIDFSNKEDYKNWLILNGANHTGQLLLNQFLWQPILSFDAIYDFFDANKNISPINFFKRDLMLKTKFLDSLYFLREITKTFLNLAKKTIYASQANEFIKPFLRPSSQHRIYGNTQINRYLDTVFSIVDPFNEDILRCFNGSFYVDSYFQNLDKKFRNYSDIFQIKDSIIVIKKKKLSISNSFTSFLFVKNKNVQEYLWGSMLNDIKDIYPESLPASDIATFKFFFPRSIFLKQLDSILVAVQNNNDNKNEYIKIDTLDINKTLKDVFKSIKANFFYVDLWATWCSPCKHEFTYNNQLDSFFQNTGIERLYISLDDKSVRKSWLKDVYFFNLKGTNINAIDELKQDILKTIFDNQGYSIPRYFIANSNGEIIIRDAPRPSDPELKIVFNNLRSE
jgi:hypothetical protein